MEISRVHDISVLHLFGEVSLAEINHIEKVIRSLKESQYHKIILDMANVDHIHYLIAETLISQAQSLREKQGDLKIASIGAYAKEIFRFTGADQYFENYATISDAILSFLRRSDFETQYYQ